MFWSKLRNSTNFLIPFGEIDNLISTN